MIATELGTGYSGLEVFCLVKNALIRTGNQDIACGLQQRLVSYSSIAYHSGRISFYTLALHKP
jgi:hypothetical protein